MKPSGRLCVYVGVRSEMAKVRKSKNEKWSATSKRARKKCTKQKVIQKCHHEWRFCLDYTFRNCLSECHQFVYHSINHQCHKVHLLVLKLNRYHYIFLHSSPFAFTEFNSVLISVAFRVFLLTRSNICAPLIFCSLKKNEMPILMIHPSFVGEIDCLHKLKLPRLQMRHFNRCALLTLHCNFSTNVDLPCHQVTSSAETKQKLHPPTATNWYKQKRIACFERGFHGLHLFSVYIVNVLSQRSQPRHSK